MNIKFSINDGQHAFAKGYLVFDRFSFDGIPLSETETVYVLKQLAENDLVIVNRYNELVLVIFADHLKSQGIFHEQCRKRGNELAGILKKEKTRAIELIIPSVHPEAVVILAEGLALGSYQFLKYRTSSVHSQWNLEKIKQGIAFSDPSSFFPKTAAGYNLVYTFNGRTSNILYIEVTQ